MDEQGNSSTVNGCGAKRRLVTVRGSGGAVQMRCGSADLVLHPVLQVCRHKRPVEAGRGRLYSCAHGRTRHPLLPGKAGSRGMQSCALAEEVRCGGARGQATGGRHTALQSHLVAVLHELAVRAVPAAGVLGGGWGGLANQGRRRVGVVWGIITLGRARCCACVRRSLVA